MSYFNNFPDPVPKVPKAFPLGSLETDTPETIIVPSALLSQIQALLRYVLMAAAGAFTAMGCVNAAGQASMLLVAIGPISGLIAYVMGLLKVRADAKRMLDLQAKLPDSVARPLVR